MSKKQQVTIKRIGNCCALHNMIMETCPSCGAPLAYCEVCRETKDARLHPHCPYCDPSPIRQKTFRPTKPKIGDLITVSPAGSNSLYMSSAVRVYEGD